MKKESPSKFRPKSFNLRDAAVIVFRQKWIIFFTFLTTAVAAVGLAIYMPNQFESRMKILVKNIRVEAPVTAERTDVSSDQSEISESQINSEIELLKSRDLLEQVVKITNLAQSEKGGETTEQDVERAVYKLEKDLEISPVKKTNIIEVSYTSKSPEIAAQVLKQLSELYLDKHIKLNRPPGTFEFFKTQADEYEQSLRDAESNLSAFQKKQDVISINQQKDLGLSKFTETQARLNDLNGAMKETDKRIAEIEKQLSGMNKRISTQSRVLPNQDSIERFNTMLVELRNRRTQLLVKFQPDDRLVKEVDEQIKTTTEALNKASITTYNESASDINPLRQNLESELTKAKVEQSGRLELRENLTAQVQLYQQLLAKLKAVTPRNDDLERQVKQSDESYQLYVQKQEESRISDELDKQKISNVSIAEFPTVPRVPYKTNRQLTVLLGLGVGLLLGFGCAITAEFFRETVHTPGELEILTDVPVLATMPLLSRRNLQSNFKQSSEPPEDDYFETKESEDFFTDLINTRSQTAYPKN